MESEKVYNSGKNRGVAMEKISKWDHFIGISSILFIIYLVIGITVFHYHVGFIGGVIVISARAIRYLNRLAEIRGDRQADKTTRTPEQQAFFDKVNQQRQKRQDYYNDTETKDD